MKTSIFSLKALHQENNNLKKTLSIKLVFEKPELKVFLSFGTHNESGFNGLMKTDLYNIHLLKSFDLAKSINNNNSASLSKLISDNPNSYEFIRKQGILKLEKWLQKEAPEINHYIN